VSIGCGRAGSVNVNPGAGPSTCRHEPMVAEVGWNGRGFLARLFLAKPTRGTDSLRPETRPRWSRRDRAPWVMMKASSMFLTYLSLYSQWKSLEFLSRHLRDSSSLGLSFLDAVGS
jgi:hypothetical protein